MNISITLAQILGPLFLIVGLGVLMNLGLYQKMIKDYIKSSGLIYLGGFMSLIFGILIVHFHNIWILGWPVLITIFGWLGVLKGMGFIMFPKSMCKLSENAIKGKASLIVRLLIVLALSVFLIWVGYFCKG